MTPRDGHQPPTTRQVGALTARVTSLPAVTTAIGVPFQVPVRPVSATGVLVVRREAERGGHRGRRGDPAAGVQRAHVRR